MRMNKDKKVLKEVLEKIREELAKPTVPVEEKEELVKKIYGLIKKITKGDDLKISYGLHDPFQSMGYISFEGRNIEITDPLVFVEAARYAANLNIYPKTNGKVCMDLTFHGLAKKEGR